MGDDDQAIFRFRGASMSNILGFDAAYPDARRVVLDENYRSGQRLLDAAHRLIRHNDPDRLEAARGIDKRLVAAGRRWDRSPRTPSTRRSPRRRTPSPRAIEEAVQGGRRAYRDFAILVRANADADPFLRSLNLRGIPWTFSGNQGLYARPEVRLCIAFLRVLARPDDSVSLYALAASPLFGVPAVDLARCGTHADRRNRWLFDVLRGLDETPELRAALSAEGAEAIARLVKELERYLGLAAELGTGELLYQFLADSGWLGRMSRASTAREEAEVQNVARFFRRIQDATQVLPAGPRARVREPPRRPDRGRRGSGRGRGGHRRARGPRPHGPQGQGARVSGGVRGGAGPGPVPLAEPRRCPRAARRPPPGPAVVARLPPPGGAAALLRRDDAGEGGAPPDGGARLRRPEHAEGQPVRPRSARPLRATPPGP